MTPTADELPDRVEVVVEVPLGAHIKRAADGSVDYLSPVACPFNYGSVPDTPSPDGEPLDAVVLGPRLPAGHRDSWRVHGVVRFVDKGVRDDKLVCGAAPPTPDELRRLERFFTRYARLKGAWARIRRSGPVRFEGWESRT